MKERKGTKKFGIGYDYGTDSFQVWFTDHEGYWVMETSYKCLKLKPENDTAEMIYFGIIQEINQLMTLGYKSYSPYRIKFSDEYFEQIRKRGGV